VIGTDMEFVRGSWMLRGEAVRSRFMVPTLLADAPSGLVAWSSFIEAQARVHPRWQLGARADLLGFSEVPDPALGGVLTPWDAPVERLEGTVGFRVARRVEIRVGWQQNWRSAGRVTQQGFPALQILAWY
jgi:hypothetical protein